MSVLRRAGDAELSAECFFDECAMPPTIVLCMRGREIGPVCREHEHDVMFGLAHTQPDGRAGYLKWCEERNATPRLPLPPEPAVAT